MTCRLRQSLLIILLAIALLPSVAAAQGIIDHVKHVHLGIVDLLVSGPDPGQTTRSNSGSGFVVYTDKTLKQTFIFTAAHIIGSPSEWLQDNEGRVTQRTIRIRRQAENEDLILVNSNSSVVAEDHEKDVAVLAIPEQAIPSIEVTTSTRLEQGDSLAILGFLPAEASSNPPRDVIFIPKFSTFRRIDLPHFKIEIDVPAQPGQSGGPIIDATGRAVAIVSENDNRQYPRFHRGVIVSVGVEMLNHYLQQLARPPLVFQDARSETFAMTGRAGVARAFVSGRGGELAKYIAAQSAQEEMKSGMEAKISAVGDETSQCDEASGRTRSEGRVIASIKPFELTGLKMHFDLWAQGGAFRTVVACISRYPVGFSLHDTEVVSRAEAEGELSFRAGNSPFDLRIGWQDMPLGSSIELIGPDQAVHFEFSPKSELERIVKIADAGNWRLHVTASAEITAKGGSDHAPLQKQPLLFIEPR